jgi:hypothetical protein
MPVDNTEDLKSALAAEASGIELLAEEELLFPVPEPEPVLASMAEVVPEPETEVAIVPEPEPAAEIKLVSEPEIEPEPELVIVAAPEPELELGIEPEPEPELVLVATPELEPEPEIMGGLLPEAESAPKIVPGLELDRTPLLADENMPQDIKEKEAKAEELASTAMPTRVCAGCGDSYHPEFLQEIEGKLYCAICALRTAAADIREKSPKIGNGKLRGTIGALLLFGLLALVVLALRMLGII